MDQSVEWIKRIVRLCIREFRTEEEKKECFAEMEREYLQFLDIEKKNIRRIMMTQFEINDMIYVLSMIIQYMDVKDFQEDLMENILRGDFEGYTGSVLFYHTLPYIKGEYRRKRLLYKKNMISFGNMLDINYPYISLEQREKKRIVIVTGQLLGVNHSPTEIVLNIAYVLQKHLRWEVLLFVCPCNRKPPEDLWYDPIYENSLKKFSDRPMKMEFKDAVFQGYQIDMGDTSLKEYGMMLSLIHAWNPYFVLDMSTTNAVAGLIGKFTTLVSFPMSIECPISEAEILLRIGQMDEEMEKEYTEMMGEHQKQLILEEEFPVISKTSRKDYTREELGLPEEKFLIAIVGNRLDLDVTEEFVQIMKKILTKTSKASFVFIGKKKGIEKHFTDEIFAGNVYYLGYCSDLMGTYKALDLYLNPKRMGGGYSGGMALRAGVPVVTLPECDVAYNCGEEMIVQNYEEMIDDVCFCVDDKDFYEKKRECAGKYGKKNEDEQLLQCVEEILEGVTSVMEGKL
ncbi:MAG: glycosyltransferase [Lachnospiraceae bacterium]|nr:glycosyltransferase [Lachnospiraceae bacterium]